jgi:hypothetical protein
MHMLEPVGNLDDARAEFDRCWPWLWASLCEFGPTHNKEQVWFRIYHGKAFLWAFERSTVLGEFVDWPIGFRDFNYWLQGGHLPELCTKHERIELWAMGKGCQRVTGRGRDGWVRAMEGEWRKGPTYRTKWLVPVPSCVTRELLQN